MGRKTKVWLIVATSLILVGCIIFGGVMTVLKWDFKKLSTEKLEVNSYDITNDFSDILINTDTDNIVILPYPEGTCRVVFMEYENEKHSATVVDGTLLIEVLNEKKWYERIGITIETPLITLCLPKSEYDSLTVKNSTGEIEIPKDFKFKRLDISTSTGDVKSFASATELIKIKASTGSIELKDITSGDLELSVSTGKITASSVKCEGDFKIGVSTGKSVLTDITAKGFNSSGSTGNITLNNVLIKEKLNIKRSTGDVKLNGCDANELYIKTDTGNVSGSLLSEKVFITKTDTGTVKVPKTVTGGKCEIETDTGNIKINIEE